MEQRREGAREGRKQTPETGKEGGEQGCPIALEEKSSLHPPGPQVETVICPEWRPESRRHAGPGSLAPAPRAKSPRGACFRKRVELVCLCLHLEVTSPETPNGEVPEQVGSDSEHLPTPSRAGLGGAPTLTCVPQHRQVQRLALQRYLIETAFSNFLQQLICPFRLVPGHDAGWFRRQWLS